MKTLLPICFLLLAGIPSYAQIVSFGVKGGVPLTNPLETNTSGNVVANHDVRRYVVGVTGELHLPAGFSLEVDALYRRLGFTTNGLSVLPVSSGGNDWQFPFLAKYTFRRGVIVHPFVDGGVTFRHVSFSNVPLSNPNSAGVSFGGGLAFKLLFLRLSPEIRYTHFPSNVFATNPVVSSNSNQVDFLVGLTF